MSNFQPVRSRTRLATVVCAAVLATLPGAVRAERPFQMDTLADGVHLFRPVDPGRSRANSLVVERDDGLLVVDAQPTAQAARELLAQIEESLTGSVRYLVLSHSHAEAAGGASAFPGSVLVLATRGLRDAMADPAYDFGAEMRAWSDSPSAYVEPVRPTVSLVIHGTVELDDGRNPVHLSPLATVAHSRGDLRVFLTDANIVHAGGVVFMDRNPYAADGSIGPWINSLNAMLRQRLAVAVGVRGPAATPDSLRLQRDSLAWVQGHTQHAMIGAPPTEEARRRVLELPGLAERFDLEASPSFVEILVDTMLIGGR